MSDVADDNKGGAPHQAGSGKYGARDNGIRPLDFALDYAAAGLCVLPLAPGRNLPHEMLGAGWSFSEGDDRGRVFVGSRDAVTVCDWWSERCGDPVANIGVVTGRPSRLLVVDMDTSPRRNSYPGARWVTAWENEVGHRLPDGPLAQTPSGGWHLWLRYDADDYMPTRVNWLPNVDVKVDGGFVAVPPSVRIDQGPMPQPDGSYRFDRAFIPYRWVRPLPPTLDLVPEAPRWLLADVLDRPRSIYPRGQSASSGGSGRLTVAGYIARGGFGHRTGSRDCACIAFARVLFNDFAGNEAEVTDAVRRVWEATPDVGSFPWTQALKCIRSARNYWEGAPR